MEQQMDLDKVLASIKTNSIGFIRFEISDQYGIARCKTIPAKLFPEKYQHGVNFANVSFVGFDPTGGPIDGTGYVEEMNFCDSIVFPDLDTFALLSWCKNTARVLVNTVDNQGKPVAGFPREVAKVQIQRLKELGYSLLCAHEHEFYLVDKDTQKPAFEGYQRNATDRSSFNLEFSHQIGYELPIAGVEVESLEVESLPGQMEITYKPAFCIRAADNAHTYRSAIKEIAHQHNYVAKFMTKPNPELPYGNGEHLNHSLWDSEGKTALFYDASSPSQLSTIAQHWIAGILAQAPAIALLHSPTINCLDRYQLDSFAPANDTWGFDNRSCALRVKLAGENRTYIENRIGSSAGSPYLSLAGMITAGIDGIQRQLPLPATGPISGSAYKDKNLPPGTTRIPNTMKDAVEAFLKDKVVTEALGSDFVKAFVAAKMHEMQCEEKAKAKGDEQWEVNFYSFL